jgi:uncharacterized membrane protein
MCLVYFAKFVFILLILAGVFGFLLLVYILNFVMALLLIFFYIKKKQDSRKKKKLSEEDENEVTKEVKRRVSEVGFVFDRVLFM